MKAFKIISHPLLLILSFTLLIISGESSGGFYIKYVRMAMPHGSPHALLAIFGIIILIAAWLLFKRQKNTLLEPVLNCLGASSLMLSLFCFFIQDKSGYNLDTFKQVLPAVLIAIFAFFWICFILYQARPGKIVG